MEDQNNFDLNSNNSFSQIQGNDGFIQQNLPGNFPQEENNPSQKEEESEKEKKQKILVQGKKSIIPHKYSTSSVSSNIMPQGGFKPQLFYYPKAVGSYNRNSFLPNQQIHHQLSKTHNPFNKNTINPFSSSLSTKNTHKIYDEDFSRGRPIYYRDYEFGKLRFKPPLKPQYPKIPAPVKLEEKIIKQIVKPSKNQTYEKFQEYVLEYGYNTKKKIEQEVKQHPENFIEVKEAVKKKNTNEKLFILGKLGESLENMGIKVVIDKRENTKNNDYIINNQFISSGLIKKNKYVLHIQENDINKINQILSNMEQRQIFIEKWKQYLSNYLRIPKDDIYITNLRGGSIKMDTIFKKIDMTDIDGNQQNIDERLKNFANSNPKIISIFKKNILDACKLTLDMLDSKGNRDPCDWAKPGEKRGGKKYYPPDNNWVGYGLRVLDLYGNNDWIGMNANPNEWAVAYHGTSESAVRPICLQDGKFYSTSAEGATGQKCQNMKNINPDSMNLYPTCGEGTYCSPHLDYAASYGSGVIIMCRVDPKLIRIPQGQFQDDEWITDGTRNTIRPYRILYKLNS